ncbi:MAG: SAM-dependent methyltransferase [Crocinitomicaceae bacterium]|nr:SAM-dependent methyltransferase [Crocinitomicaceae bacterium]
MTDFLSDEFWNNRYVDGNTGWDLGEISPPIKAYVDQLENKELKILIPGAGNGHEVSYLFDQGFRNVHVLDFAPLAMQTFLERNPEFPTSQAHTANFFDFEGAFDLIIEQTLFCAIDPCLRSSYAEQSASLLRNGGKLVGVLFNREFDGGPPFGGSKSDYVDQFKPFFSEVSMEECYNSIGPRQGNELFIRLTK